MQKISTCEASYAWPQWSPDGKNIAYLSSCGENNLYSLYVIPGSGQRTARKVTSGISAAYGIDWSPDGQWVAWVSDAFPYLTKPIFKSKISGETTGEPLTSEKVPASHPVWTP